MSTIQTENLTKVYGAGETAVMALDHVNLRIPIFGVLGKKIALARFSRTFATLVRSGVPMESVAVGDTVGSMGIPNYVSGARKDFFSFVDTKLSRAVAHGFHAMALDERRRDFPVTRWDRDARIEEVWFVGAHSDVGGGYPADESGLSNIALHWMTQKLSGVGVLFVTLPDETLDPKQFGQAFHTPWKKPPFNIGAEARTPRAGDVFHPSVSRRWQTNAAYRKLWPKGF